jgi:hypothetical protein
MPISQFIKSKMVRADINRLNIAYAEALRMLDLVDRDDPITAIVGEKVVEVGTSGMIDSQLIADAVVGHFLHRKGCPGVEYQIYILTDDDHIKGRKDIFCDDDEAAKKQARQMVNGHAVELWQAARKIAKFTP